MQRLASFKEINVYHTKWIRGGVCLPGIGIFINKNAYDDWFLPYVIQHEYGHYLDYKYADDLSPLRLLQFYIRIGLPSLLSAATKMGGPHRTFWTEIRANRMAKKYLEDRLLPDFEKYFPLKAE